VKVKYKAQHMMIMILFRMTAWKKRYLYDWLDMFAFILVKSLYQISSIINYLTFSTDHTLYHPLEMTSLISVDQLAQSLIVCSVGVAENKH